MVKEIIAKKIYQTILGAKKTLLITHYSPDGDAVSSLSAMMQIFEFLKKDYVAFCADKFEDKYIWLPGLNKVVNHESAFNMADFDLIITLDCGNLSRTRLSAKIKNRLAYQTLIEIDHHEASEKVTDLELRLNTAASTTEVIYDWLKINHLPIWPSLAEAILVGLVTDTGNFIYSATSNQTLAIASEMLNQGANWPKMVKTAKLTTDLGTAKLWGLALSRLKINRRYQVAFTVLTAKDFEVSGVDDDMIDGLPGFLSGLGEVKAVLVLKEAPNNIIKGSWRACQDDIDVAKLCRYLGGGGHVKAAGFQLKGKLETIGDSWQIV